MVGSSVTLVTLVCFLKNSSRNTVFPVKLS